MPELTEKQRRFVEEYPVDWNATQAAIRAGYKEKAAYRTGWENLRKPQIQEAIARQVEDRSNRTQVTQDYVIKMLVKNLERAMQYEAVLDDDGNAIGEYRYAGNVANKALELLGRHLGMFADKLDVRVEVEKTIIEIQGKSVEF